MRGPSLLSFVRYLQFMPIASAATLRKDENQQLNRPSTPKPPSFMSAFPSLDTSSPSLVTLLPNVTTSSNDDYGISCDSQLGGDFDLEDCLDALRDFELGRDRVIFSERPSEIGVIALPFRWMGVSVVEAHAPSLEQ
ncbi:MAG: hypothetical protein Q9173_001942 [Seirophora scorigena]